MDAIQLKLKEMEEKNPSTRQYNSVNFKDGISFFLRSGKVKQIKQFNSIYESLTQRMIDCEKAIDDEQISNNTRFFLKNALVHARVDDGFSVLSYLLKADESGDSSPKIREMIYELQNSVRKEDPEAQLRYMGAIQYDGLGRKIVAGLPFS